MLSGFGMAAALPAAATVNESGDVVFDTFGIQRVGNAGTGSIDVFGRDPGADLPNIVLGSQPGADGTLTIRESSKATILPLIFHQDDPPREARENAIWVGFEGAGRLSVVEGSILDDVRALAIASRSGSTGTVLVDGPGTTVNMTGLLGSRSPALAGGQVPGSAQAYIGLGTSGQGTMTVSNGAVVNLDPFPGQDPQPSSLGISLGGDFTGQGGGHGTLTVTGAASAINVNADNGFVVVGSLGGPEGNVPGSGEMHIIDGGSVALTGTGISTLESVGIGAFVGTVGTTVVDGAGSSLDGGDTIGVGTNASLFDADPGNDIAGGVGTLIVRNGGTAGSDFGVFVGADEMVAGDGTIIGGLTTSGGTIAPGNSPGVLTVIGNVNLTAGGTIQLEIASDTDFDQIHATGLFFLGGASIEFIFGEGVDPTILTLLDIGEFFQNVDFAGDPAPTPGELGTSLLGTDSLTFTGVSPGFDITAITFDAGTGFAVSAAPVPVPPAFALLLAPVAVLLERRRAGSGTSRSLSHGRMTK